MLVAHLLISCSSTEGPSTLEQDVSLFRGAVGKTVNKTIILNEKEEFRTIEHTDSTFWRNELEFFLNYPGNILDTVDKTKRPVLLKKDLSDVSYEKVDYLLDEGNKIDFLEVRKKSKIEGTLIYSKDSSLSAYRIHFHTRQLRQEQNVIIEGQLK